MQRAMGWVIVYRQLEKDLKSNYPLYRKGIVTPDYWFSIKSAEEALEKQFDGIIYVFFPKPNGGFSEKNNF